jgi:hypothetical protein
MHWYFKFVIPIFAAAVLGMGYVMTPPKNGWAEMDRAKACKGFVVFNGERVPKCER